MPLRYVQASTWAAGSGKEALQDLGFRVSGLLISGLQ